MREVYMRKLLIIGSLCAATLPAADFAGTWLGDVPFPFNGDHLRMSQQVAIKLVQSGSGLTGKLYGEYESSPIIDGKVSGDTVDFVVVAQEQQSNQITETRMHFTGTLQKDGSIEVVRVRESATNAGNSGDYKSNKAANNKQTFVLKRIP
jgi:hypothetical protein